ncbi:hypothetical protein P154DRAFT_559429 [Amniculicola lignicola CBS 123094]|uniref:Yeast cell wall synthesis Kre9/Knh1-like N-terminal domain-containing protein n=1 Tax=Amniculicola lignicola CBS 123094 TaxID=1392246 RepID=A0A6A5WXC5_9PLEO|nr:hypothetical protein P154DRAFT_559429 [Amniculicola lignicola CBS 123094]
MFSQITAVAFFSALVAAQLHAPVGEPNGNPIAKPGLLEVVPACKAYTITWTPTTTNTVSILLLRGPSTNVKPLGAPLAEGIKNSGTLVWTPASDLEADDDQYGLQLIDDVTGQYQYSTQFGISKDDCKDVPSSSSAVSSASSTPSSYPTSTPKSSSSVNITSTYGPTKVATTTYYSASTGYPVSNSSIIYPSKSMTVPSSLKTTATGAPTTTTSTLPESTGAAAPLRAGLGLAGAVAAAIFML